MSPEERRAWLAYEMEHRPGWPLLPVPDPQVWVSLLLLGLEAWNHLAWEIRQALTRPTPPLRPLQRYRPGRHHLVADMKPRPLPEPDPMDAELTAYLRDMAARMAPHYERWN